MKINKSLWGLIAGCLFFRIVLDLSYLFVIDPNFSCEGFVVNIDKIKLIESYILTLILASMLEPRIERPSAFLVGFFYCMVIIPQLSLFGMRSGNRLFTYLIIAGYLVTFLTAGYLPAIKLKVLKNGKRIAIAFSIAFSFFIMIHLLTSGGMRYLNFDLSRVYEFRSEAGELINIGAWGYLVTWAFKIFNPALIVFSLWSKRKKLFILVVAIQVLLFGISNHKAVLFYPALLIGIYFLIESNREKILLRLTFCLVTVVVVSGIIALYFNNNFWASLLIRRVFYVPADLNYAYYELFSEKGHVYLSNSFLLGIIPYPFAYPPQYLVSMYRFGMPNCWANTGFLATSFMHFGVFGVIVYSVIVGFLLRTVDSLVKNRIPLPLGIAIVIIPFFSLFSSADLTTALLTHGLLASIFMLWLFGSEQNPEKLMVKAL